MNYISQHCHSQYSLVDGLSSPTQIANKIATLNQDACAITDHGNINGHVQFYEAMQKVGCKPLLGIEFYISLNDSTIKNKENRKLVHQVLIAKNLKGWLQLAKLVSTANNIDNFYHRPRLDAAKMGELCSGGNIMSFGGHLGSWIANILIRSNYDIQSTARATQLMAEYFGKDNFFLEIQLVDAVNNPECLKIAEALREVSTRTGIKCVATGDSHYTSKEDVFDHRLILCTNLKTTFNKIAQQKNFGLKTFFQSDNFYIHSTEEMLTLHDGYLDEIANTQLIADMCEDYSILKSPQLPKYKCPNDMDDSKYLRELCRIGWKTRKIDNDDSRYIDRIKHELDVLQNANLASYFLTVHDITNYIKEQGWVLPTGRGSSAGSLVSYLLGVTQVDPIKHNLIFERFYNLSRVGSLPDIDLDIATSKRDQVIDYITQTYGENNVAQIVTYGSLKGRSALKAVLRANEAISFDEMCRLTEHVPDEARISADLQEMKEERGKSSIIQWALEHHGKLLKEWCYIDKNKKLQGRLSRLFEQAIRIEDTLCTQGRHASGVIVSVNNLYENCPMIMDTKTKKQIVGFDLRDSEKIGLVKLDVLGLSLLDKIAGVRSILKTGDITND